MNKSADHKLNCPHGTQFLTCDCIFQAIKAAEARNADLLAALDEVTRYADLVGSQTDEVHIAVMKLARKALAKARR